MMKRLLCCQILLWMAFTAFGQTTDSIPTIRLADPDTIVLTDGDSVKYFVGKCVSITGLIKSTYQEKTTTGTRGYLNMFKAWPDNPFAITIFQQSFPFFSPLDQFKDKHVRLIGIVNGFKDKKTGKDRYSIVLKKPAQIEIIQ